MMYILSICKITVDLITDYQHVMFQTDVSDLTKFPLLPHTSDRIVRTAHQE